MAAIRQHGAFPATHASFHLPLAPAQSTARPVRLRRRGSRAFQAAETAEATPQAKSQVVAEVEKTSWTSRRLFACVPIEAPVSVVWSCLTDYEGLGNFIPSLSENECLQRRANGAVLRQVGAQEVAMGVRFSAACTLECTEYLQGTPPELCGPDEALLPVPRTSLTGLPCQDIVFDQLDGDFQAFRGIWRMQPRFRKGRGAHVRDMHGSSHGDHGTLLSYALYVKPKAWLPVGLIQDRIEKEVVRNLEAVRAQAERLHTRR